MKKYTKPMIVFESFTLSTNIALDCGQKATNASSFYTCGIEVSIFEPDPSTGEIVLVQGNGFTSAWSGCVLKLSPDDAANNGFCYDIPTSATLLFNS